MPLNIVYMLQQVEYAPLQFVRWFIRLPNISGVMHRKKLVPTSAAKLLVCLIYFCWVLLGVMGITLIFSSDFLVLGVVLAVVSPILSITSLLVFMFFARITIVAPRQRRYIEASEKIFQKHKAKIVAVAGSYGKTTMKELLATVLSEKFVVAVTEGNMNTPIAHARFAARLSGDEDILIIEYGEGAPGDVKRFARTTHPDYGFITGLAPNHLDAYKTIDALADDILSLRESVKDDTLLISGESTMLQTYLRPQDHLFTSKEAAGWKITDIKISVEGTSFSMRRNKTTLNISSKLLGRHQVAPLAAAASFAFQLGLSKSQIQEGLSKTTPFAHRMCPYSISGAQIIDDTYNGNLEGSLAGIELLSALTASRKIYVTPGLVEQGEQKAFVHQQIAKALITTAPDLIVLMRNSATSIIEEYLLENQFTGQLKIEDDPLTFYQNLAHFVAKGDLVMMQNDWTDNYN